MAGTFQLTYVPGYTLSDSSSRRCLSNSAVLTKTTSARFPSSSSCLVHKLNVRLTCAPNTRRPFVCRASSGGSEEHGRDRERETALRERFEKWCQTHGVVYGGKEEWMKRFEIYKSNLQYIDYINSLNLPYKLKDSLFADMTLAEYMARFPAMKNTSSSLRSNRDERLVQLQAEPDYDEEREFDFDSQPAPVTAILEPEEDDDVTFDVLSDDDDESLDEEAVESENSSLERPAK